MTELRNPFIGISGYECFGCAPHNPTGLKMRFFETGEELVSHWDPDDQFQGYNHVLHGGVQATLMDELASWVVFVKLQTAGVTQSMEVTYHKPARTNAGLIVLRGSVSRVDSKHADVHCRLFQSEVGSNPENPSDEGVLCSEASCHYVVYPEHIARRRLYYPGIEAFYNEEGA